MLQKRREEHNEYDALRKKHDWLEVRKFVKRKKQVKSKKLSKAKWFAKSKYQIVYLFPESAYFQKRTILPHCVRIAIIKSSFSSPFPLFAASLDIPCLDSHMCPWDGEIESRVVKDIRLLRWQNTERRNCFQKLIIRGIWMSSRLAVMNLEILLWMTLKFCIKWPWNFYI